MPLLLTAPRGRDGLAVGEDFSGSAAGAGGWARKRRWVEFRAQPADELVGVAVSVLHGATRSKPRRFARFTCHVLL